MRPGVRTTLGKLTSSLRFGPSVKRCKGNFAPISHVKRADLRFGRSYSETVGVWSANILSSFRLRLNPVVQRMSIIT